MVTSPVRDAVAALTLVVLTNGPLFFIERKAFDLPGVWEGPVVRPAIVGAVASCVLLVVLDSQRTSGARLMRPNRWILLSGVAYGAWGAVSVFWSVNPESSLWRGVIYMALPLVAWILADLDHDRFERVATIAFGSLVAVSIALVVLWSSTGLDRNDDWKGIFTNRNGFAPVCAVAIILGCSRFLSGHRWVGAMLAAASVIALLGTGSRTAWIALVVALGTATLLVAARVLARERAGKLVPVGSVVVGLLGAVVVVGAVATRWDESTFVQRRTIWDLVGDRVADHPVRGHGFQAFWTVPELIGEHELLQRGSAHGSVPEILLGLGAVGLILWAIVVLAAVAGTVRAAWLDPGVRSWFWMALTVFLIVENATESFVSWFSYNWVLLIAAALRSWPVPLPRRAERTVRPSASVTS